MAVVSVLVVVVGWSDVAGSRFGVVVMSEPHVVTALQYYSY